MEFHENSINGLVAGTRPQVDSRRTDGRTFGVSAPDPVFLLRKKRLITISLDEIKKQFLSLLVAQPTANHSTVLLLHRYAPHNDVTVNDGPHIRRWSHKIVIYYIIL
jgi:hypothetical protein